MSSAPMSAMPLSPEQLARAPQLRTSRQRARFGRRQRGAIFVEAIIVSSMLIVMFASAVFFHALYASKMRATREARLAAWQQAEEGCPSTFGVAQLFNLISIDNCADESCSVGGLSTQSDTGPDWLEIGAKTGEMTRTVTADQAIDGRSYTVRAYNRVICNERPQNERGDLASIGEYLLDAVIQ
jgi:hypothetical protein